MDWLEDLKSTEYKMMLLNYVRFYVFQNAVTALCCMGVTMTL